jgi:SAM-dependent methyltransferase
VDFSQHCNKQVDAPIPRSGIAVDYYRCEACEFIFTLYIDNFTSDDLLGKIYNEDYIKFDPLYPIIRPTTNAGLLISIVDEAFKTAHKPLIIDYGAGNGMLSKLLTERLRVKNYDALNPLFDRLTEGTFDIIFCSEVVEHIPTPHSLLSDWTNLMSPNGCVIFSTTVQPDDIATLRGDWWYLGPRNGHVSLFSTKSLELLCNSHGLQYEPIDEQWHFAWRQPGHAMDVDVLKQVVATLPKGFVFV